MSISLHKDFFELFGLPRAFRLNLVALEAAYHDLHAQVHPDRHAHLPDVEKRRAMQWATRVNEAFVTLKNPLSRARYMLELEGVDAAIETNTAMSSDFLMEQMEWREAVEDARTSEDALALEHLHQRLAKESKAILEALAGTIDDRKDYMAAAETVRQLMFLDKLQSDIDDALEALES